MRARHRLMAAGFGLVAGCGGSWLSFEIMNHPPHVMKARDWDRVEIRNTPPERPHEPPTDHRAQPQPPAKPEPDALPQNPVTEPHRLRHEPAHDAAPDGALHRALSPDVVAADRRRVVAKDSRPDIHERGLSVTAAAVEEEQLLLAHVPRCRVSDETM